LISEVKEDVKVDEKEPIESIISTGEVEEKIPEGDVGESDDFDIEKFLEKDPVGVSSTEESGEVVEEKALEADRGEGTEEKKQFTVETSDFDIQEFLEELGTPPSEKDLESEKE